jgi:tyrosyl-tRNA synthetase
VAFSVGAIGELRSMRATNIDDIERRAQAAGSDLRTLSAEDQYERIMSRVSDLREPVVSPSDLLDRLRESKKSGVPLKVKFGIDPTGPDIHVGHTVSLLNLRLFQRMGHQLSLVIGDFTGMIGDPSGRLDERPALTEVEVRANMATYEAQASRIVNLSDPSIERHYNSEWMSPITVRQWVDIIKQIPVSELLQREDFRNRLAEGHRLSIAELEYAVFMGYDSVVLNPDIELGGIDQYLNMHMCRQMMANANQKPEIIISYNLLPGTTGERDSQGRLMKMSKRKGNYIPITASPDDMYGKVMSIPDEVMWIWYRELTDLPTTDIEMLKQQVLSGELHPKSAKQLLARIIVGTFNHFDLEAIARAEDDFNTKFGKQAVLIPDSTTAISIQPSTTLVDQLVQVTKRSKNELRRLVKQKGIHKLQDHEYAPLKADELEALTDQMNGMVIRIGRRHYYRFQAQHREGTELAN